MKNIKDYVRNDNFNMILKNNIIDIENYTNIGNISSNEIIIYNENIKIIIKGKKLYINRLMNNEILIKGKYNNIIFSDINE